MATAAQSIAASSPPLRWLWQLLKEELSPYPGRGALVTRIVIATTIVMIINMVFRLPYAAYGAVYAVTISRENSEATLNAAKTNIVAFAASALYVLAGALLFLADPTARLVWVIGTFFLMFFALRVLTNYTAAARFGYLLIITIPLWDEHTPAELKVENTLWAFAVISCASLIAAMAEWIYASLNPRDEPLQSIADRLRAVEELLSCYADDCSPDSNAEKRVTNLALVGTSRLRRFLKRANYSPPYAEQMGALVAIVGRLIDIAANLIELKFEVSNDDRPWIREIANNIASIRSALLDKRIPSPLEMEHGSYRTPLLEELRTTVSLIPGIFTGAHSLSAFTPLSGGDPPPRLFVHDALSNPDHVKFALKGCLAASLCYLIYNGKDWPGISTAVTTCFLTALSTVGSSRQKQVLRIAGAIVGGILLGIGAQIFVLPYLESITGFTLLFLAVTIPAVWIATSGSRLSYFGVQILVAFYLINLSEFNVQTSLVPGRDRVIGIFLGLLMMWLAFDQMWSSPAIVEMKKTFVSNVRLLAEFIREPASKDKKVTIQRSYFLREAINRNFDGMRSLADGVLLEFGQSRKQNLEWRDKVKHWQPQLRLLFLAEIALWKYRVQLPGFELPESVRVAQRVFDDELARGLEAAADQIEGKPSEVGLSHEPLVRLESEVRAYQGSQAQQETAGRFQAFVSLQRRAENLATSLQKEMAARAKS